MSNLKTYHRLYLLGCQVVHDCRAVVLQRGGVAEQRVDRDLGGHAHVAEVTGRGRPPLRDVEQPLSGGVRLEEVGELGERSRGVG